MYIEQKCKTGKRIVSIYKKQARDGMFLDVEWGLASHLLTHISISCMELCSLYAILHM